MKIRFSGTRDIQYGQTDSYKEANGRFSQFCERFWGKKNYCSRGEQSRLVL